MGWSPNPRVTIGGTDFTDHAIGQVSVTKGRRTVYERPNAGYATAELIDTAGIPTFRVGDTFVVAIDRADWLWAELEETWAALGDTWADISDPIYVSQPIFTGTLSDFTSSAIPARDGAIVTHQLQAVGPLSVLNRRTVYTAGRLAENDGERVLNTLNTALGTALVDASVIDDGVFDLAAIPSEDAGYNALQIAQDAGFSGEGLLYETADGFIGYADANSRLANEREKTVLIPFGVLSAEGLSASQQVSNITNAVTVEYASGAVFEEDTTSIATFGRYETELRTDLVDLSNAEKRATKFLESHSVPSYVFDRLNFPLFGVPDVLRNDLLELRPSLAVTVSDVPSNLGFTQFRGFVEGFTLTATPFDADLTFIVSDRRLSIGAIRWQQVVDTIRWTDVDPTLTWADAIEVTT
jgi:hypothetical protein